MAIPITGTTNTAPVALEGQVPAGQGGLVTKSKEASETTPVGLGVVDELSGYAVVEGSVMLPDAPAAADPDALVLQSAALGAATESTYELADFDGAYAGERLNPPRPATITADNDVNWDATDVTFEGEDEEGHYLKEVVTFSGASGNETLTTDNLFSVVTRVTIAAQTGDAPGTIGFGAAPSNASLDLVGVVARSDQLTHSLAGVSSSSDASDYADGDDMTVVHRGKVGVFSEDAASAGDPVYVRHTSDGGSNTQPGKFRSTPDGTNCYRATGWIFKTDSSGSDNAAIIERR